MFNGCGVGGDYTISHSRLPLRINILFTSLPAFKTSTHSNYTVNNYMLHVLHSVLNNWMFRTQAPSFSPLVSLPPSLLTLNPPCVLVFVYPPYLPLSLSCPFVCPLTLLLPWGPNFERRDTVIYFSYLQPLFRSPISVGRGRAFLLSLNPFCFY